MLYPDVQKLFADLRKLEPIKNSYHFHQMPGTKDSVFLLEKSGEHYFLMPSPLFYEGYSNVTSPPPPDVFNRILLYAILCSFPQQVMVGLIGNRLYRKARGLPEEQRIHGHTSITFKQDILYAGELIFEEDKLLKWNNFSGHYRPKEGVRFTQLTPNVKRLLPEALFNTSRSFRR